MMKNFKLNKFATVALAAATIATVSGVANACSRILVDTPHGESVVRTLDWAERMGAVAEVMPVGKTHQTGAVNEYQNAAKWTAKYQTVALRDFEVFHGVAAEAINVEGLASSVLYMEDSVPFLAQYKDNGAPAVNLADISTFFAQNFKTVQEAKAALEQGEFQIAWNSELPNAGKHGLHVSVQDKSGDVMLIQLNEGGKVVIHNGQDDLRVMANEPLQQEHREYVKQFDFSEITTANKLNTSISSLDRNARLLWTTNGQKNWDNLTWAQTEAKLQSTYDAAALVPQDIIDPNYMGTYTTWIQYIYNLENGSVKVKNFDTYSSIRFNMNDIKDVKENLCADLASQASAGFQTAQWETCQVSY
ncbi:linear amide C-N hydrolase [Vibrio sinaloensis]|uniref:linear amide C-N hydrolase n=1 Tax=Photobacterium sp. (strain ATCC 43367) TaxID=379097 RepID=UPI0020559FB0|nr:linear amide C-N hydrolase [Vibrio sinaloensis]UPQ90300.1 linear amide C-N hydrolase [Vibrio sinaloensis]